MIHYADMFTDMEINRPFNQPFVCRAAALAGSALLIIASLPAKAAAHDPVKKDRARVVLAAPLPKLDGKQLKATLVEVNYGPGEASPVHSHPCAVMGYVVEGVLRMQVKGEEERVYKAGEGFYEAPYGVHTVSANDSSMEPAKFVAYFICDHDAPLSADVHLDSTSGGTKK